MHSGFPHSVPWSVASHCQCVALIMYIVNKNHNSNLFVTTETKAKFHNHTSLVGAVYFRKNKLLRIYEMKNKIAL